MLSDYKLRIYSLYGPTESIEVTSYACLGDVNAVYLGKPIQNIKLYVLDTSLYPVPVGVMGELYIGGAGLARGYLNKPTLTKERFIPNLFATSLDHAKGYNRLYKTGDLVRWLADGTLEYVCRNDFQVKIRGHRIELAEVEQTLLRYPSIQHCIALVKNNQYIVVYYVTKEKIDEGLLRRYFETQVPDYMIPHGFVHLLSLPLTTNGKLDRRSLPDFNFNDAERSFVKPRTKFEAKMCAIWKEVLGLEQVGVTDDFFKIGGHSILAMQLVARINKALNCNLALVDIFRFKRIADLIEAMPNKAKNSIIHPLSLQCELLPNIYFIHPGIGGSEAYQKIAEKLTGRFQAIGIDNYNIINTPQIERLADLASHYINEIQENYPFVGQIILCGWSLGGLIALEMAYQLEQQGFETIDIYLLDTRINDEYQWILTNSISHEKPELELRQYFIDADIDNSYAEKVIHAATINRVINGEHISGKLCFSEITLFKAMELDTNTHDAARLKWAQYALSVKDNNIQAVSAKPIKVVPMNCRHDNMIEKTDELFESICQYSSKNC